MGYNVQKHENFISFLFFIFVCVFFFVGCAVHAQQKSFDISEWRWPFLYYSACSPENSQIDLITAMNVLFTLHLHLSTTKQIDFRPYDQLHRTISHADKHTKINQTAKEYLPSSSIWYATIKPKNTI